MSDRAVLFDLDGTLRNTIDTIYESLKVGVREVGGPELSNSDIKKHVHHHTHVHAAFIPDIAYELFETAFEQELHGRLDGVELYDNAKQVIRVLYDAGWKLAIVSSAKPEEINAFLLRQGIDHYFSAVVGDDGSLPRKPSPEPLREAMRLLQVATDQAVMVGDMVVDIEAAIAAKLPVIAITHGFASKKELQTAGATKIVDSLEALPAALAEMLD